jgi:hypothetical protein
VSNRASRLTKAGPQAVRGGKAAHRGFEPRLPDPESSVLPVERMGIECGRRESNAQATRFELVRYAKVPFTPAWCAARDLNPETFGLRIRCSNQLS